MSTRDVGEIDMTADSGAGDAETSDVPKYITNKDEESNAPSHAEALDLAAGVTCR